MLRYTLILATALLFGNAHAQVDNQLRIGMSAQYDMPFGNNFYGYYPYFYFPSVQNELLFTAGGTVSYGITEHFEVESGLLYSRKLGMDYGYYCFCDALFCQTIAAPSYKAINTLEIPMLARYYVLPGALKLHFDLGHTVAIVFDDSERNIQPSGVNYNVRGGLGVDYFFNNLRISAGANYTRKLASTNYYWSFRNNLGLELKAAFSVGSK